MTAFLTIAKSGARIFGLWSTQIFQQTRGHFRIKCGRRKLKHTPGSRSSSMTALPASRWWVVDVTTLHLWACTISVGGFSSRPWGRRGPVSRWSPRAKTKVPRVSEEPG